MGNRRRRAARLFALVLALAAAVPAAANPEVVERARRLLNESNPKAAFTELVKVEGELAGNIDFDYLLGVAALDSGKLADAVIAFERVLARNPNHAGALMDLSRAYYATGSLDLAYAGFKQLADSNPPPGALEAINRYLDAIQARRTQTTAGWQGYTELGLGYDSNLSGAPTNFGAAALQSFGIFGIDPTGNSVRRKAGFGSAAGSLEYSKPLSGGWSIFGGGEGRLRGYAGESNFNAVSAEARAGAALNDGPVQWRLIGGYIAFNQKADAPGDPKPTSDRRTAHIQGLWKYSADPRNQFILGLQLAQVRFPDNLIEDFNQTYLSASWVRSFEAEGVPLLSVVLFGSHDDAVNLMADGVTDKSKNIFGLRSYLQYSVSPALDLFGGLGYIQRRDLKDFARSTTVTRGKDGTGEFLAGLNWRFRKPCSVRMQLVHTRNGSNVDLYDFNRSEVSTAVRCEFN